MASTLQPHRRAPSNRSVLGPLQASPSKQSRSVSGSKRPHSPEHGDLTSNPTAKRVRASTQGPAPVARGLEKEKKKSTDREQQAIEFKEKYRRAFPGWVFYLDNENLGNYVGLFDSRIEHLKARIEPFFSRDVTHVITNLPIPRPDKENLHTTAKGKATLKSPIKLVGHEQPALDDIVDKAVRFNCKIWNGPKLESILSRCLEYQPTKSSTTSRPIAGNNPGQRDLMRLLQTEKLHGTTERDPTQKRHDYHYFSRGSCFVLLEDMRQELATIAAHEYPVFKDRDKQVKKPWPVLHCHPHARNPFVPFDDREKKRWERLQEAEKEQEEKRVANKRELQALKARKPTTDLRKSVSVSNLHRRHSVPTRRAQDEDPFVDLDGDIEDMEPVNASGYIAASGNSVGITSTTGTTSTTGRLGRTNALAPALAGRLKNHVVTSMKFAVKDRTEKAVATGTMGPPSQLPNKEHIIKRSKSTNTLRLPKRQEGVKPGYCESCRIKFSDFNDHTVSSKHRKFASNDANFQALDAVIQRIRRKTVEEVERKDSVKIRILFGKISLRPLASNSRLS